MVPNGAIFWIIGGKKLPDYAANQWIMQQINVSCAIKQCPLSVATHVVFIKGGLRF